jgi:hypothetical protein
VSKPKPETEKILPIEMSSSQQIVTIKSEPIKDATSPEILVPFSTSASTIPLKTTTSSTSVSTTSDQSSSDHSSSDNTTSDQTTSDHSSCLTTTQGLPSPASSTSETSDYQRSTPSPRNEACNGDLKFFRLQYVSYKFPTVTDIFHS